ncbi:hypothetical protein HMI54_010405 [Coelomomyces lativittatus]|nr:hypothetical protein HMI54_010405 [Coelomomyces lativittatus]KAJ1503927.1 hypothetical protein HMI56_001881 [Coelomomyces lativittatus]
MTQLVDAEGKVLEQPLGIGELILKLKNHYEKCMMIVKDALLPDVILGMPFLKKWNPLINWNTMMAKIVNTSV